MRFRCGRGYQQTVLSIIRAKFSTHSFIPSRLVSTRCNANWPANVHRQYLKVLNASTCSFLLLANFSFEHSLKWKDQNMLLNVTHITMFGWELSKTNSLRWLHTLKASTAMLKLVHLPYSAQGLVCADLCHLDGFLCYCLSVTVSRGFFFFTCLTVFIHVYFILLCFVHEGLITQNAFLHSTALLFHWCISICKHARCAASFSVPHTWHSVLKKNLKHASRLCVLHFLIPLCYISIVFSK